MNLGGPVWHASVSSRLYGIDHAKYFDVAELALRGVGDATLGEWREVGGVAVHLRRRLTVAEMRDAGIEAVCDVRGTEEFTRRLQAMRPHLPAGLREMPDAAFP